MNFSDNATDKVSCLTGGIRFEISEILFICSWTCTIIWKSEKIHAWNLNELILCRTESLFLKLGWSVSLMEVRYSPFLLPFLGGFINVKGDSMPRLIFVRNHACHGNQILFFFVSARYNHWFLDIHLWVQYFKFLADA